MTQRAQTWRAESYGIANTGQFETALEALMLAGAHLHSGGRFADVGCGSGELAWAMAQRNFEVVANDFSPSMVEATRQRCVGLPVEAAVQDSHQLALAEGHFQVVHSSWMIHWLSDAEHALRTMAKATCPGGLVVLQWSCGQPRVDGFALRDVVQSVADRPQWRDRLAEAPITMFQHPLDEVAELFESEGLEVLVAQADVRVPGGEDPEGLRKALRAAAFAVQAEVLGDDADRFVDEAIHALLDAGALNPHNARLIARRPLPARASSRAGVRVFPLSVGLLEVVTAEQLTPLMRRLTFQTLGSDPLPLQEPAETITLIWPAEGAEDVVLPEIGRWRFPKDTGRQHTANLTVRRYDPSTGLLTVDFFLHGDHGAASRWAAEAGPGAQVGFGGSRVHWVTDPTAEWVLLVGDETTVPSIAAIAETLPPDKPVIAVVEVRDEAEQAALDFLDLDVHWVHRGDREPGVGRALEDVVRSLDLPTGRGQVWAGGESLAVQSLRKHLLDERGLGRDEVCALGYWNRPRNAR